MCASVLLFLLDKVCVFLVSNFETGLEAFLNPSQHSFEFPGSVPMVGGAAQGGVCLVSLLSLFSGSIVSPAPSCHCHQLGCLLSIQEALGGEGCVWLKSQGSFAVTEPLFTSHRVPQQRIKELP